MKSKLIYKGIEVLFLKDKTIFTSDKFKDSVFITYKPVSKKESKNLIDNSNIMFTEKENTYGDLFKYYNRFGYIE